MISNVPGLCYFEESASPVDPDRPRPLMTYLLTKRRSTATIRLSTLDFKFSTRQLTLGPLPDSELCRSMTPSGVLLNVNQSAATDIRSTVRGCRKVPANDQRRSS